jgi:hypothetical protein
MVPAMPSTKYLLVGQSVWHMAFTPDEKYLLVTNGGLQRRLGHRCVGAKGDQNHPSRRTALGHYDGAAMTAIDASAAGLIAPDVLPRPDTVAIAALSIGGVSHSYGPRRALIDGTTRSS